MSRVDDGMSEMDNDILRESNKALAAEVARLRKQNEYLMGERSVGDPGPWRRERREALAERDAALGQLAEMTERFEALRAEHELQAAELAEANNHVDLGLQRLRDVGHEGLESIAEGVADLANERDEARGDFLKAERSLLEQTAVCLCGCPESEHECGDEEEPCCGDESHSCAMVSIAVAKLFAAEKARADEAEAKAEDLEDERDKLRDELADLREDNDEVWRNLRECTAVCICGCPESDHECGDEEDPSCGNDDHACAPCSVAVGKLFAAEKARADSNHDSLVRQAVEMNRLQDELHAQREYVEEWKDEAAARGRELAAEKARNKGTK